MNRNDDRATRSQRRRIDPESIEEQDALTEPSPRRRRSQAARMVATEALENTIVPPSREEMEQQRQYGRPGHPSAAQRNARRAVDLYDEELEEDGAFEEDSLYDDEYDDEEAAGRRPWIRWVVVGVLILALLAGATFVGVSRPDLIDRVVQFGAGLLGAEPTQSPEPVATPVPTPMPTQAPDVTMAKVVEMIANPVEQPDINLPISFQVTTTEQTNRIRIVDGNGQILIEGLENDFTDVDYGRLWNLTVYFLNPYEGNVEAYPGNEAGWNEANSSVIAIKVGDPEAEVVTGPVDPEGSIATISMEGAAVSNVDVRGRVIISNEPVEGFVRESYIQMGDAEAYRGENGMRGVLTFRGSNMRQNSAYGVATIVENKLSGVWSANVGVAADGHATWGTQPLIVQWHSNIRKSMDMDAEKGAKAGIKEVILAANDGQLYFFDVEDGKSTRDALPIDPAAPMLGTPSVSPLGLPLIAVGSGDPADLDSGAETALHGLNMFMRMGALFIRNERLEAVSQDTSYITSPLIDNGAGMLVSAGGNGLLYTMTLNPSIDVEKGTMTLAPTLETYVSSYGTVDMAVDSAIAAYGEHVFYATNGGILQCVNLNTLTTVWALNIGVDTDAAVALDVDAFDGSTALYTASRADNHGDAHLRRIDAGTGAVRWDITVPGNCSASPLVGQEGIGSLVIFTVSNADTATMYALDKETGEQVWTYALESDTMASPMAMYDEMGASWIVQGDGTGLHLVDGETGERLDKMNASSPVIGSPAAFDNMIVVITQNGMVHGIQVK